jgi:hypothetical protein
MAHYAHAARTCLPCKGAMGSNSTCMQEQLMAASKTHDCTLNNPLSTPPYELHPSTRTCTLSCLKPAASPLLLLLLHTWPNWGKTASHTLTQSERVGMSSSPANSMAQTVLMRTLRGRHPWASAFYLPTEQAHMGHVTWCFRSRQAAVATGLVS